MSTFTFETDIICQEEEAKMFKYHLSIFSSKSREEVFQALDAFSRFLIKSGVEIQKTEKRFYSDLK